MEIGFQRVEHLYLNEKVRDYQNVELTQEVRISDDQPDIGKVLASWGQIIIRGKEWSGSHYTVNGGLMTWVLYMSEGSEEVSSAEAWLPLQFQCDTPDNMPGTLQVYPLIRYVDARNISARKLIVRAGTAAMLAVYCEDRFDTFIPKTVPEEIQLLRGDKRISIPIESAEKSFRLQETIEEGMTPEQQLLAYTAEPTITEQKVIGNKVAVRGNCTVKVRLANRHGDIQTKLMTVQFSQFAELEGTFSSEAKCTVTPCITEMDLKIGDDEKPQFSCEMLLQFVVEDYMLLDLTEDAYIPGKRLERHMVTLPCCQSGKSTVYPLNHELELPADIASVLDMVVYADFPTTFQENDKCSMEISTAVQILYSDVANHLKSQQIRCQTKLDIPSGDMSLRTAIVRIQPEQFPKSIEEISALSGAHVEVCQAAKSELQFVTGLDIAEDKAADPARPSLIVRKAGTEGLWALAKACGSTVDAICTANNLQDDPKPDQVLLIPIL